MENITVNVFDDVLYLAWEFVYLIFFTRFVCVHGNYKNACAILEEFYKLKYCSTVVYMVPRA